MKKLIALLLCLVLTLSLASVAAAESAVPDVANTFFSYGYDVGGSFFMDYFIHFYDEIPGLGRVFYGGFCMNQITYSGTYEILAEEREYACWPDRATLEAAAEDAAIPTGTAPFTVVFYDFDGNEIDRCAMDAEHVYNDMTNLTGVGGENAILVLDTNPENSEFTADYENEQAVAILSLIDPEDDTATLDLKVNGKYDDLVVYYVEGTYAMNEDQSEIVLTPNDESDEGATVTRNEDGTYTYLSTDGTEVTLVAITGPEVVYSFKGEIGVPGMEGMNADLLCNLLDDGTMKIYADFMGNQMDIDQGTYDVDMTTYSFTFHFDIAGDITSYFADDTMKMDYAASVEVFGDMSQTLAFVAE